MIFGPIAAFFIAQNYYEAAPLKCGLVAAGVANLVIVGYVIAAFTEETPSTPISEKETKKNR